MHFGEDQRNQSEPVREVDEQPRDQHEQGGTVTVYTPIITQQLERIVVPASERVGEKLMEFTPGKVITLARPKKRCAGLNIIVPVEHDGGHAWAKRIRPTCLHDISEYLLHLWQIPELNKHFGVAFRPAIGTILRYDDTTGAVSVVE